jgi:hypothetical protein
VEHFEQKLELDKIKFFQKNERKKQQKKKEKPLENEVNKKNKISSKLAQ